MHLLSQSRTCKEIEGKPFLVSRCFALAALRLRILYSISSSLSPISPVLQIVVPSQNTTALHMTRKFRRTRRLLYLHRLPQTRPPLQLRRRRPFPLRQVLIQHLGKRQPVRNCRHRAHRLRVGRRLAFVVGAALRGDRGDVGLGRRLALGEGGLRGGGGWSRRALVGVEFRVDFADDCVFEGGDDSGVLLVKGLHVLSNGVFEVAPDHKQAHRNLHIQNVRAAVLILPRPVLPCHHIAQRHPPTGLHHILQHRHARRHAKPQRPHLLLLLGPLLLILQLKNPVAHHRHGHLRHVDVARDVRQHAPAAAVSVALDGREVDAAEGARGDEVVEEVRVGADFPKVRRAPVEEALDRVLEDHGSCFGGAGARRGAGRGKPV
mmetsp:Transcript_9568/g.22796  ORF Transcript_9568/g.22796 Transcript_9568/m.22796 type:complete len:377 (+) Transcript_9568:536-1666(+)